MIEHAKSNVYISDFISADTRLLLYKLLEQLNEKVLYFDTDSILFVSPTVEHLVKPDRTIIHTESSQFVKVIRIQA